MNMVTEKIPDGCERLNTQRELAARVLCSVAEAGRRIITGRLVPVVCTARSQFYSTRDLNEHRLRAIGEIGRRCAALSIGERAKLVALFTEISAAENQRTIPNAEDRAIGERLATEDTRPDSLCKEIVGVARAPTAAKKPARKRGSV